MSVSVDRAVIAKYSKGGEHFEILVDPEKAIDLKSGKNIPLEEILAIEEIFEDAKKGLRAGKDMLKKVFGTEDTREIAKVIITHGEVQITTEQRRKMMEEKKRQIATIISRESINPQTNAPHTVERILNAMEIAKVSIDLYKSAEEQVKEVLTSIQRVIPIKLEKVELKIKVPCSYAGKCYGIIKNLGKIKREEWLADGSLFCIIEIPPGLQTDLFDKLNKITSGDIIIEEKGD